MSRWIFDRDGTSITATPDAEKMRAYLVEQVGKLSDMIMSEEHKLLLSNMSQSAIEQLFSDIRAELMRRKAQAK